MPTEPKRGNAGDTARIADEAARWLARRDRGLSSAEQDQYLHWLAADPRHAEELRRHGAAFERMMQLYEWQPGQSADANPDLFAPGRRRQWLRVAMACAAVVALGMGAMLWSRAKVARPAPSAYLRFNEQRALPDGSRIELKEGAKFAVRFTASERRVVLFGEGHFEVAKELGRTFVVEAGGALVKAVGTAFNVRVGQGAVEVLVTEGSVQVEAPATPPAVNAAAAQAAAARVGARERAVIPLQGDQAPTVGRVSEAELVETLAWKAPRLHFTETPLAVAVGEFNRHNRLRIVIGEPELGSLAIGGTFQVNNVEGFVRLLEFTLDVRAERRGTEIILRHAP
jgi:transmembrane sensor